MDMIHMQTFPISTHTLRGERDRGRYKWILENTISTHTLRGERDIERSSILLPIGNISTHTLRGERDMLKIDTVLNCFLFQLTRSVGSVTHRKTYDSYRITISTHTLRGERDWD